MPAPCGGDDLTRVCGPDERPWAFIVLGKEAVDGSVEVDERVEDAAFETAVGQLGEEALNGIQP